MNWIIRVNCFDLVCFHALLTSVGCNIVAAFIAIPSIVHRMTFKPFEEQSVHNKNLTITFVCCQNSSIIRLKCGATQKCSHSLQCVVIVTFNEPKWLIYGDRKWEWVFPCAMCTKSNQHFVSNNQLINRSKLCRARA